MGLAALGAESRGTMVRSATFPDPLTQAFEPKFAVADPFRGDRQIQTLGKDVKMDDLYDMGTRIGSGGFGTVKDIIHASTFQPYAVKVMQKSSFHGNSGSAEEDSERKKDSTELTEANFRDIMELLMNTRHRFMATIERVFEDRACYYVVMQKCTGGDLQKHISTLQDRKQRFDEESLREVVRMVADALRFLHSMSRVHRDVKPENVLYETEARQLVKLADFDMCCNCEESFVVGSSVVGTLGYLAPEVLCLKRYSRQSDMFGLGGLMYYCATLSPPKGLVAPRDVTAWCEATQKALSAGTGVCANASVDLRQAIGTLLSATPHLRPAHIDMFMECAWLGGNRTIKRRGTLKSRTPRRRDSIQRLLQVDELRESPSQRFAGPATTNGVVLPPTTKVVGDF
jgi:serine/threonine protein kinase